MKNKIVKSLVLFVSICALTGCGQTEETDKSETTESQEQETQEQETKEEQQEEGKETSVKEEDGFSLEELSGVEFYFASGVGGWATILTIEADGSFEGIYHDTDMGSVEDEYPGGVVYLSECYGELAKPEKINEYTYSVKIENLQLKEEVGEEEIKDDIKYIYSEPYGLEDTEELIIYLPGAPLEELPEEYRSWVGYGTLTQSEETELPFYGIYNEEAQCGFSGYKKQQEASMETELVQVEEKAAELEDKLAKKDLTQAEMTEISEELYTLWDDALNDIWSELKKELSEEEMADLLTEQRKWIEGKEAEMKAAGAAYEGGSMQTMAESEKGAELTKIRVYKLAELL